MVLGIEIAMISLIISWVSILNGQLVGTRQDTFHYFPGWLFLILLIILPLILTITNPEVWIKIGSIVKDKWTEGIKELKEWRRE